MKKYIFGSLIGLAAFTLVGGAVALAGESDGNGVGFLGKMFGHEKMLETKAEALNMTVDQLETELESKSMPEILDEQGITHEQLYNQRQEMMLEQQALTLNMTVDELSTELEDKTFAQLLDEKGISHTELHEQRHEQMQANMTEHLQQLVDDGEITQEQMDEKIQHMEERQANGFKGHGMGKHGGGMGFKL